MFTLEFSHPAARNQTLRRRTESGAWACARLAPCDQKARSGYAAGPVDIRRSMV